MNYNKVKAFEKRYIKSMSDAIERVQSEFQKEFLDLVKDNLEDDVYICSGMGSTSFYKFDESGKDTTIENKTTEVISNLEWGLNNNFGVNLSLPYKMTSKAVLTKEAEDFIEGLYKSKGGTYRAVRDGFVSPHLAHIRFLKGWKLDENIIK